jgi:anti-anti-sigma factor
MSEVFVVEQDGNVGKITLSGRIDSSNAPALAETLQRLVSQNTSRVVCLAHELTFISSMGLRAFVVAKQKFGKDGDIFLIGASPDVVNIFVLTGFDRFILIQDSYPD